MKQTYVSELFAQYRRTGILIDTNILLLHFIGMVNRKRIGKFNRTEKFTLEDYDLLQRIIAHFEQVIITPNVMTEVSNLMDKIGEPERSRCFALLAQVIPQLSEFYLESQSIAANSGFTKFGLTDCGILDLAREQYLVLTDDLKLAVYLQREGVDVVNFNTIRVYNWR